MRKTYTIILMALGILIISAFTGFAVWQSADSSTAFAADGFILRETHEQLQRLSFKEGAKYSATLSGQISFRDADGHSASVPRESFAHFDDNTSIAFSDGVLLDFNDLSENFINNYYIPAGMVVTDHNGSYVAETAAGTLEFGEHMWKLTDCMYLLRSSDLKVHFSDKDVRDAGNLVQVYISDDSLAYILTEDDMWTTISPDCYIQTANGVKVYPVSLLVDSGRYKMSLAKLAVTTEDAIVLTEAETRRQIVPELNIEAIDGEDGEDGTMGVAGQAGQNGQAGTVGQDGEGGKGGVNGNDGLTGSSGNKGTAGKDALSESSTYNAIPTMSITRWDVTADGLSGTLKVVDPSQLLLSDDDKYPGKVTLTNKETGEVIACYPVASDGTISERAFAFSGGTELDDAITVDFATKSGVLTPDTEYTLSVTGYYHTTNPDMTYQREFLSRDFTTDSTGVVMAYDYATTQTITLDLSIDPEAEVNEVFIYLLTPAQEEKFTKAVIDSSAGKTGGFTDSDPFVDYWKLPSDNKVNQKLTFGDTNTNTNGNLINKYALPSNTKFVARAYVTVNGTLQLLTRQELEVSTLKQPPVPEIGPKAIFNRTNGMFEVWRPAVSDPDGGAKSYTYTAYKDGVKVASRTVVPGTGEPIEFPLTTGDGSSYTFGVTMEFDDNEKTLTYDMGLSDPIIATGDTMPRITLTKTKHEYNKLVGTISIPLGTQSRVFVSPNTPLEVNLYADAENLNYQVLFTAKEETKPVSSAIADLGTMTLRWDETLHTYYIELNLTNLFHSTSYAVAVSGYVDLGDSIVGDSQTGVKRSLGTVTFATKATPALSASWVQTGDQNQTISVKLRIYETGSSETLLSYAEEELLKGHTALTLYRGTGARPVKLDQKVFSDDAELKALYGEGYTVTGADFPNAKLTPGETYSLILTEVVDETCFINVPYTNTFTNINPSGTVISAAAQPPNLRVDPWNAIKVTQITNEEAAAYGATVDTALPSNAVIGFTLTSDYDNISRIGKSITYYAYEYKAFKDVMHTMERTGANPLNTAPLLKMTVPIDSGSDDAPKVAILFGNDPSNTGGEGGETPENGGQKHGQYYVFYSGVAQGTREKLGSGMGRGYRYLFAYTVQYEISTQSGDTTNVSTLTYPNDSHEYAEFNTQYGGLTLGSTSWGKDKQNAYVLNSGIQEVPNILPTFYTYLAKTENYALADNVGSSASGTVELHYAWRDPEGMIKTELSDEENTKITSKAISNYVQDSLSQDINKEPVTQEGEALKWYKVQLPFTVYKPDMYNWQATILEPRVTLSSYDLDYNPMLTEAQLPKDEEDMSLTSIPVEWPYLLTWGQNATAGVTVTAKLDITRNVVQFVFSGTGYDGFTKRGAGVRVKMKPQGSTEKSKEFYAPLNMYQGYPEAVLSVSQLGPEFENKVAQIESFEMVYDTGLQGWEYVVNDPYFTLQYINDKDDNVGYTTYYDASQNAVSDNLPVAHAMLNKSGSFALADLRKTLAANEKQDAKYSLHNRASLFTTGYRSTYLLPTARGIDIGSNDLVTTLSGRYGVPKKLDYLKFSLDSKVISITGMTPTMDKPYFTGSGTTLSGGTFSVYGLTGDRKIYAATYSTREAAESLSQSGIVKDEKGNPSMKEIVVPESNQVSSLVLSIPKSESDVDYYVAFYFINAKNEPTLLRYGTDMSAAVFQVQATSKVKLAQVAVEYLNNSYFGKVVNIKYSISPPQFISMSAAVYANSTCEGTPVMDYAQLREKNILTADLTATWQNTVTLNLSPRPERAALLPGATYYLKLTATETQGNYEVGTLVVPFSIAEVGNISALIRVSKLGRDETGDMQITYNVTINDKQNSLMAASPNDPKALDEGGLYAVRFVDNENKILKTPYDDKIFSVHGLRQPFVLSDKELSDLSAQPWGGVFKDRNYTMMVFALPDPDHDGQILVYDKEKGQEVPKTYADFFEIPANSVDINEWGEKMNALINSFWQDTSGDVYRAVDPVMESTMNRMLIEKKTQNTGTGSGYVLSLDIANVDAMIKNSNTIRVEFTESFNLTTTNQTTRQEECQFEQIDYYIEGESDGGEPIKISGSLNKYKDGEDKMIRSGTRMNLPIYYLEINEPISSGRYVLTLHFYVHEVQDTTVPTKPDHEGSFKLS